jgi:hypothetical protein
VLISTSGYLIGKIEKDGQLLLNNHGYYPSVFIEADFDVCSCKIVLRESHQQLFFTDIKSIEHATFIDRNGNVHEISGKTPLERNQFFPEQLVKNYSVLVSP